MNGAPRGRTGLAGAATLAALLLVATPAPSGAASGSPPEPLLYGGRVLCPFPRYPERCESKPVYNAAIHLKATLGSPARRLTDRRFDDWRPAWSPDRTRIAFVRSRSLSSGFQIWVANADGTGARRISRGRVDTEPDWSPDGRWIAYRSGTDTFDVFVVRPEGSGRRNVTRNPAGVGALAPTWSPDGRRIAFQRTASAAETGIYSIGVDGRGLKRLARDGSEPDWSPDGRRIAYIRRDASTGPGWQVYTMGPNGGGKRRVTGRGSNTSPTWSPDSTRLALVRNDRLAVLRADGTGLRFLTAQRRGFAVDGIAW